MDDFSNQSDANTENSSSTADSSDSSVQNSSDSTQEASSENTESNLPFNDPRSPEHARFKELRDQASSFKEELQRERQEREAQNTQFQQMQAYIQQMQAQNQKQAAPAYQPLIARLKDIDPEFADWQLKSLQASEAIPQLQQQLQQMSVERDRRQAYDSLNTLYESNKVPQEQRAFYEQAIKTAVYEGEVQGKRFTVSDIPKFFKQAHDQYSKFFEDHNRKLTASYVVDKKKDAVPSTTKGGTNSGKATTKDEGLSFDDQKAMLVAALRKDKQSI